MTHSLLVLVPQRPLPHPTTSSCHSPCTTLTHARPPLAHTWQHQVPSGPNIFPYKYRSLPESTRSRSNTDTEMAQMAKEAVDAQKLRSEFLKVLRSRRVGEGELMTSSNCYSFDDTCYHTNCCLLIWEVEFFQSGYRWSPQNRWLIPYFRRQTLHASVRFESRRFWIQDFYVFELCHCEIHEFEFCCWALY